MRRISGTSAIVAAQAARSALLAELFPHLSEAEALHMLCRHGLALGVNARGCITVSLAPKAYELEDARRIIRALLGG